MKYLLSIILSLWAGCAWAFPPGFIGAVTQGSVGGGGPETLTPATVSPVWNKSGAGTNLSTLTDTDDGTYFYTSSTSSNIVITMGAATGGESIATVKMCARLKRSGTSTAPAPRLRLYNGATYQSFLADPISSTLATTFTDYCSSTMATNPYTSGAWTATNLNALSWIVNSGAATITAETLQVSKVWAEVTR